MYVGMADFAVSNAASDTPATPVAPHWQAGGALAVGPAGLTLGGVSLGALAHQYGTPLYAYDAAAIRRRIATLRAALATIGVPARIHYALKAL